MKAFRPFCLFSLVLLTGFLLHTATPVFAQCELEKLIGSDISDGEWFGFSAALDGDVAVIGARNERQSGYNAGAAYVFRFDGNSWMEEAELTASDAEAGDLFGVSVDVSG